MCFNQSVFCYVKFPFFFLFRLIPNHLYIEYIICKSLRPTSSRFLPSLFCFVLVLSLSLVVFSFSFLLSDFSLIVLFCFQFLLVGFVFLEKMWCAIQNKIFALSRNYCCRMKDMADKVPHQKLWSTMDPASLTSDFTNQISDEVICCWCVSLFLLFLFGHRSDLLVIVRRKPMWFLT